jgi:hypothetical protein
MGNAIAHCATANASPSTAFAPPQGEPSGPGGDASPELKAMPPPQLGMERNPGSFDELHKKCKGGIFVHD